MMGSTGPTPMSAGPAPRGASGSKRRRLRLWVALGVGAVGLGLVAVLATAPAFTQVEANSPLLGRPAPDITGTTLADRRFSLSDFSGHFVVVDFLASWCVACRAEQPQLSAFVAEHAAAPMGPRLVGVVFNDSADAVRSFLGREVAAFPVIPDPQGALALDYGVRLPPEKYLVDPSGRIIEKFLGSVTRLDLDRVIARAELDGS